MIFAIAGLATVLALCAISFPVGRLVTNALVPEGDLPAVLAVPVGASILGLELWVLGAVGLPWNRLTLLLPPALAILVFRVRLGTAMRRDLLALRGWWRDGAGDHLGREALVAIAAVFLLLYLWALVVQPLEGNDAVAMWLFKARLYLAQGRVDLSAVIQEPTRHLDYPPLYSLVADVLYVVRGQDADNLGKAATFPFVIAIVPAVLTATAALGRRWSGILALLVLSLPLGLNQVYFDATMGYADYMLAVAFLLTLSCLAAAETRGEVGLYALALVLAGMAAMTKNEGQVLALSVTAVVVYRVARGLRGRVLAAGFAGLLPLLAWKAVVIGNGYHSDLFQPADVRRVFESGVLPRAVGVIDFAFHILSFTNDFGWIVVAGLLALELTVLSRLRAARTALLVLALQVSSYYLTYVFTPYNLENHMNTTIDRLFLQVAPALILVLGIALGAVLRGTGMGTAVARPGTQSPPSPG